MDDLLNLLKRYLSNLDLFDLSELTSEQRLKLAKDVGKLCCTLRDILRKLEEAE